MDTISRLKKRCIDSEDQMENLDIHNYKARLERRLRLISKLNLTNTNLFYLVRFKDYCISKDINYGKIDSYLFYLSRFITYLKKDVNKATKEDIINVVNQISLSDYSENTKKCFKFVIKKLYQIMDNMTESNDYPESVRWISLKIKKCRDKLPEELLTIEEMNKLVENTQSIRDKAFISTLCESGARIGEIAKLKIKHITFEEVGCRIQISGKTGTRRILIIKSANYLKKWISVHPYNLDQNSLLWFHENQNKIMCYNAFHKILKKAAKNSNLNKRIYPHLLRHSRATYLADYMTESVMDEYLGWVQGSKMSKIYVHMSGRNTDTAVLKANHIEIVPLQDQLMQI